MSDVPSDPETVSQTIDYVKIIGLILATYAAILSSINFWSDRVRSLKIHVEKKQSEDDDSNVLRIYAVCRSGTILVPEIEVIGKGRGDRKAKLGTIHMGEILKKGDLRVFDYPVDAMSSYSEIWAEVSGYKVQSKSNVIMQC